MRRVAALVAIVLLTVLGTGGVALAGPATTGGTTVPAGARREPAAPSAVRLDLSSMSPRVVTGAGSPDLVFTGSITNTGDVPVENLGVRAQRGGALGSEAEVRNALDGDAGVDSVTPPFTDLGTLAPGATLPFRYSVPLTGDATRTLSLSRPGTYPILLNVNGSAGGERSRLTAARMLLPVSGLPGTPPADPPVASPFTLLYPITDAPRRIPPVPGEGPVLTDDDLAGSFAPGGRLRGLVDALNQQAPTGSPVRNGTCLAIDPELVATAAAMRGGYQVAGPDGALTPGRGADAAGQWLGELTTAARGSCVLALPASDADLVALVRGGQADLARTAVEQGRRSLSQDLQTPVLDDALWPAGGVLDEPTLQALPGVSSVLLSAEGVSGTDTARTAGVVPVNGPQGTVRAVLTDPLLTDAAGGGVPDLAAGRAPGTDVLTGRSGPLSDQDLVGAIGYRAQASPGRGPVVIAPPHQWPADGASAAGLLSAVAAMIGDGRLAPTGLSAVTTTAPVAGTDRAAQLYYPVQAGGAEVPPSAVSVVADQVRGIGDLQSAAEARTGVGADPVEVFDSLRLGTLRAVSAAWRGRPADADRNAAVVADRIGRLRDTVRVLEPPSPYSLGTSDAPLLLTVANGLPVTMNVRVVLSSTSGLRVAPIPEQSIPPLGRIQVRGSAKVTRAGVFAVDAGLETPNGAKLGGDTRLRVRSTVYGTVTVWLTAVAGALLIVLVVRRVLRRIRPADGRPGSRSGPPDPPSGPDRGGDGAPAGGATGGPADGVPVGAVQPAAAGPGAGATGSGTPGPGTPAPGGPGPNAPCPNTPGPNAPGPDVPRSDAPGPNAPGSVPGSVPGPVPGPVDGTAGPVPGPPAHGPGTPGSGTPGPRTPWPGTPGPRTPNPAAPGPGTPSHTTAGHTTAGHAVPGHRAPGTGAPGPGTPGPGTPVPGVPGAGTPGHRAPGPGTPGPGAPVSGTPWRGTPRPGSPGPGSPGPGTPGPGTPGPDAPGSPAPTPAGPVLPGPHRWTGARPTSQEPDPVSPTVPNRMPRPAAPRPPGPRPDGRQPTRRPPTAPPPAEPPARPSENP